MNSIHNSDPDADFILLSELLFSSEDFAEGRASSPLADEEKDLLRRVAHGESGKEERETMIRLVVSNREAMDYFASTLRKEPSGRENA